jgi:ABC-type uncharacterized transport system permease subunit
MFRIYHYEFREAESASAIKQGVTILFAILLSLFLGGVLIRMISKVDPFKAYWSLFSGAFGSKYSISETFVRVIPLMLMGLATTVCFRAQIWNIGGNGQLLAGAVAATVISLYAGFLPPAILIALILPAAAMAGGMMNYIFEFFSIFLLEEVWREATWGMPWTELFPENAWWPVLYPVGYALDGAIPGKCLVACALSRNKNTHWVDCWNLRRRCYQLPAFSHTSWIRNSSAWFKPKGFRI